jgi:hypothetical protein
VTTKIKAKRARIFIATKHTHTHTHTTLFSFNLQNVVDGVTQDANGELKWLRGLKVEGVN